LRRLNNEIKGLEIGGQWCEDPVKLKEEIKRYFETRFAAQPK